MIVTLKLNIAMFAIFDEKMLELCKKQLDEKNINILMLK